MYTKCQLDQEIGWIFNFLPEFVCSPTELDMKPTSAAQHLHVRGNTVTPYQHYHYPVLPFQCSTVARALSSKVRVYQEAGEVNVQKGGLSLRN